MMAELMLWFVDTKTKRQYKIYRDCTIEGFDSPLIIMENRLNYGASNPLAALPPSFNSTSLADGTSQVVSSKIEGKIG